MGVRSDNFSKLIAIIVVEDKNGVVSFLRSQGINASESASNSAIIQAIGRGMQSDKFIQAFSQWAKSRYEPQSNFNYKGASGGFDPMATQGGGSFDAMSSQEGTNLMEDNFANASGFDPMDSQSGRFTPISTQGGEYANLFGSGKKSTPYDKTTGTGGTKVGGLIRGFGGTIDKLGGVDGIINKYLDIREQDKASSDARALAQADVEVARLELEKALALGKIKSEEYERQMNRLDGAVQGGGGNTVLYIVLGVVLLSAIGTTIYFATRKK
jgi:hypothetical protein